METDFYFLNFKQVLVVLTSNNMRQNIIKVMSENEIDANFVYVESYFKAATLINEQKFDPFDYIILDTSKSNKKLKDFLEFIEPCVAKNADFVLEYSLQSF